MIVEELYDALIEAGASEEKARAASRAIADMQGHFTNIQRDISHLDQKIDQNMVELRSDIDRRFSEFRSDIEKKFLEFRSDIEKRFSEFRSDIEKRFSEFRSDIEKKFSELRSDIDRRFSYVDQRFTQIDGTLRLHNWMLGTILAFLVAVFFKVFSH